MARTAEEIPASLTVRPSAPALGPLIGALGYAEGRYAHPAELSLPTGGAQLLVNLDGDALGSSDRRTGGAALQGPFTEPAVIDPAQQRAVVWVAFQAHLIHEFRALAGITPTAYAPRSPRERNHVPLGG